jgi:hypothetical protein
MLTFKIRLYYNLFAGWRGILLSPASFAFETLAPRQPVFFFIPQKLVIVVYTAWRGGSLRPKLLVRLY